MNINIKTLKQLFESAHINFLYGSGLSQPYLPTLGNIENFLSKVDTYNLDEKTKNIIKASLFAKYFKDIMVPCLNKTDKHIETLSEYVKFIKTLNSIIAKRKINLINKQINIFTTNIDDFIDIALEETKVEFNNGFKGHINPTFNEDTFSNVISKTSSLYQNNSTIPIFNLLKIHGSINWKKNTDNPDVIVFDQQLTLISEILQSIAKIPANKIINIESDTTFEELIEKARNISQNYTENTYDEFSNKFNELIIINPTKAKFSTTVLDYHFYELMRMYSNALERASSLLIVAGFSFADEHISNITIRAANANPTLQIIVFAYDTDSKKNIEDNLNINKACNNNICVISPEDFKSAVKIENPDDTDIENLSNFNLKSLNKYIFNKLDLNI